ncbi:MAG: hypothetical protein WDW38_010251 [Sanguina aurantia]
MFGLRKVYSKGGSVWSWPWRTLVWAFKSHIAALQAALRLCRRGVGFAARGMEAGGKEGNGSGETALAEPGVGGGDGALVALAGNWWSVAPGQCFCLLGPNGAGKTTTIKCLTGALPPDGGDALIYGRSVRSAAGLAAIRSTLGVCPQFDVLWGELTGAEHLRLFAAMKGMAQGEVEAEVGLQLEKVRLTSAAKMQTASYSGGMRRRLSVAVALLGDPRVVILDEPTTGMDPVSRRHVWELIHSAKAGRVIVLTTHSMEEADILGDRIGIFVAGRLRCLGSGLHLKGRHGAGYKLSVAVSATEGGAVGGGPNGAGARQVKASSSAADVAAVETHGAGGTIAAGASASSEGEQLRQRSVLPMQSLRHSRDQMQAISPTPSEMDQCHLDSKDSLGVSTSAVSGLSSEIERAGQAGGNGGSLAEAEAMVVRIVNQCLLGGSRGGKGGSGGGSSSDGGGCSTSLNDSSSASLSGLGGHSSSHLANSFVRSESVGKRGRGVLFPAGIEEAGEGGYDAGGG